MNALIIANGDLIDARIVRKLRRSADLTVCADGGGDAARKYHVVPDVIVGDLDSLSQSARKFYRRVPVLFIDDQNSTDLEKAIAYCIRRKCRSVSIVGSTGSRIDHMTGSLACFKKFRHQIDMTLLDREGELILIEKSIRLKTMRGERISLIPLERCTGVTTQNLVYALRNDILELGVREGTSNIATANTISVRYKTGTLLLYRPHRKTGKR